MSDLIPAAIGCALTVALIAACSWFDSRNRQAAQEPPGAPGPQPGPKGRQNPNRALRKANP